MRRILVTGASGFVGLHLLPALEAAFPDTDILPSITDVTDPAAIAQDIASIQPDGLVHLAAVAAIADARRDPARAWTVNLHGALHVGRAVLDHAPHCRMLFTSSADIYGGSFHAGMPLDETAVPAPLNTYAATKAAADLALGAMAAEGLRVVRARPFNHTGPGQSEAFVVPAFARQIARVARGEQNAVLQVGALEPERDFLDVRDVCAAYALCLKKDVPPGTVLNIASGTPRRVGDVLAALLALAGIQATIAPDAGRMRPTDIRTATGDASRARRMLGWAPTIPWEQTLRDVLDHAMAA